MYEYKADLVRVIDGDTAVFDIDLGFSLWVRDESVRFARIDTPETRTRDLEEKARGYEARDFVVDQFHALQLAGGSIRLKTFKDSGKYGRFIAEIILVYPDHEVNLNDLLLENNLAELY